MEKTKINLRFGVLALINQHQLQVLMLFLKTHL